MHDSQPPHSRPATDGPARSAWKTASLAALLVGVAAVLGWMRLPASARGVFWAEDGKVFVQAALQGETFGATLLLEPYGGYLHLVPRVLAAMVVSWSPLATSPQVTTALSVVVVGLIAAAVFHLSAHLAIGLVGRLGLYAITFLSPAGAVETLGNLANLHWYFLWLAPWLFLARPRTRGAAIVWGLVALVAVLTEVQAIIFIPLVLWKFRGSGRGWIAFGAVAGALAQVTGTLLYPRGMTLPDVTPTFAALVGQGFVIHVGGAAWTATSPALPLAATWGWPATTLLLLGPFLALAGWLLWKGRLGGLALLLVASACLLWIAASVVNNLPLIIARQVAVPTGQAPPGVLVLRHAVVPAMLLAAVAVVAADELVRRGGARAISAGTVILVALGVSTVMSFSGLAAAQRRHSDASWADQLASGPAVCSAPGSVSLPVVIAPKGWQMLVPCERVGQG